MKEKGSYELVLGKTNKYVFMENDLVTLRAVPFKDKCEGKTVDSVKLEWDKRKSGGKMMVWRFPVKEMNQLMEAFNQLYKSQCRANTSTRRLSI